MTRGTKKKAFTLVEMLVVVAIIGILMALLMPALSRARKADSANSSRLKADRLECTLMPKSTFL